MRFNYTPGTERPDPRLDNFVYTPATTAARYEPGHVSYLGYCAVSESLEWLHEIGIERALAHSVRLNRRLVAGLDPDRCPCISTDVDRSPIVTFQMREAARLEQRLRAANVVVTLADDRVRVSPVIFNDEQDTDRLLDVTNG